MKKSPLKDWIDNRNELSKAFAEDDLTCKTEVDEPVARDLQFGGDHYKTMKVQPWDVIDTWSIEQQIGFYRGNALKYVMRMGSKDEQLIEIKKAAHYITKLIEVLEHVGKTD